MVNYLKDFEESFFAQTEEDGVEFAREGKLHSIIAKDKVEGGCLDLVSTFAYRNPCISPTDNDSREGGIILAIGKEHGIISHKRGDIVQYKTEYVTLSVDEVKELISKLQKTLSKYQIKE